MNEKQFITDVKPTNDNVLLKDISKKSVLNKGDIWIVVDKGPSTTSKEIQLNDRVIICRKEFLTGAVFPGLVNKRYLLLPEKEIMGVVKKNTTSTQ